MYSGLQAVVSPLQASASSSQAARVLNNSEVIHQKHDLENYSESKVYVNLHLPFGGSFPGSLPALVGNAGGCLAVLG
jgi:hypothetical protein